MERSNFGKLLAGLVQLTEPQRKRLRLVLDTAAQSPLQALVATLPPPQGVLTAALTKISSTLGDKATA